MTVQIHQTGPGVWEQSIFTNAQPEHVFSYIAAFERHVEWELELQSVKTLGPRRDAAAREYLKIYGNRRPGRVARMFSRGIRVTCILQAVDPPKSLAWKQYRSHQASGPDSFQTLEFFITPRASGSRVVVIRRFSGMETISTDAIARFSRWSQAFQGLPPDVRHAAGRSSSLESGVFATRDEMVWRLLDGHPSRGPGPTSLKRLAAILDAESGPAG